MRTRGFDVCVFGAGAAGSMIAARLAQLKYNVALVAPPPRVGDRRLESISPGVGIFLERLGFKARLEQLSVECEQASVCWASDEPVITSASRVPMRLVGRSQLGICLMRAARDAGVELIPAHVSQARVTRVHHAWKIEFPGRESRALHARFVIWATGRAALLGHARRRLMPPLLALETHWHVSSPFARSCVAIEAMRNGWIWSAEPRGGNQGCAILFVDPRDMRSSNSGGLASALGDEISGSRLLRRSGGPARVRGCDASSSMACNIIGADWLCVGDAALAMEPISSQGIQGALKMGSQGAVVVHTMLSDPARAGLARRFYQSQAERTALSHIRTVTQFYGEVKRFSEEPFWRRRAAAAQSSFQPTVSASPLDVTRPLALSQNAKRVAVPCLIGESIRLRLAIECPELDGPIAYVGNTPIDELLNGIETKPHGDELCRRWVSRGLTARPLSVLRWLLDNAILQYAEGASSREEPARRTA
jgi:flavin-dependent dehydrogenase